MQMLCCKLCRWRFARKLVPEVDTKVAQARINSGPFGRHRYPPCKRAHCLEAILNFVRDHLSYPSVKKSTGVVVLPQGRLCLEALTSENMRSTEVDSNNLIAS